MLSWGAEIFGALETAIDFVGRKIVEISNPAAAKWRRLSIEAWDYFRAGRITEASTLFEQALQSARSSGRRWPQALAEENCGIVQYRLGNYDASAQHLGRALELLVAQKRAESSRGSRVRDFLAAALVACERYEDARAVLQVQLETATRQLGPRSASVIQATEDLADICFKAKDYERAETYYRQVLTQVEFWTRPDHAVTGYARIGLAKVMRETGRTGAAEHELMQAYENWSKVGKTDLAIAAGEQLMDLLVQTGRGAAALPFARQWYRKADAMASMRSVEDIAKVLERYAGVLRAAGEQTEAERYERRLAAIAPARERQREEMAAVSERLNALRERDAERFRILHEEQARRSPR